MLVNPLGLTATELLVWGTFAHALADWPAQNHWMATHKMLRRNRPNEPVLTNEPRFRTVWWDRHPAAYVHAGIHVVALAPLFGWAALGIGLVHLLIDTRTPLVWWSRLVRQTQPEGKIVLAQPSMAPLFDMGVLVRVMTGQVAHVLVLGIAAILVTL